VPIVPSPVDSTIVGNGTPEPSEDRRILAATALPDSSLGRSHQRRTGQRYLTRRGPRCMSHRSPALCSYRAFLGISGDKLLTPVFGGGSAAGATAVAHFRSSRP